MSAWEIVLGVIFGLLVNEATDISPWLARKLVRWAAYRWAPDQETAARYAEEWTAIIEQRPGKLFKLLSALSFAGEGVLRVTLRSASGVWSPVSKAISYFLNSPAMLHGFASAMFGAVGTGLFLMVENGAFNIYLSALMLFGLVGFSGADARLHMLDHLKRKP